MRDKSFSRSVIGATRLCSYVKESEIIESVVSLLRSVGFIVMRNVEVGGVEVDVLAIELVPPRPMIYVVEAKRRPKRKLIKQLERRSRFADYVYAAVPLYMYAWAVSRIDPLYGIMVFHRGEVRVLRMARYIGNGVNLLRELLGNEFADLDVGAERLST